MDQNIMDDLAMYFPSIARDTVDFIDNGYSEIILKLNDGSCMSYDIFDKTIRVLPQDGDNLSEDEYRREFSMRLRRMMRQKDLRQNDLAESVGVTPVMISRYIRGTAMPSFYIVDKIAKALGCSSEDLRYHNYFN